MIRSIGVVVPAADEQDLLAACLDAMSASIVDLAGVDGPPVTVRTVVVLDDCHDASAAVVERFGHVEGITIAERCVGAARRVGCARILDSTGRLDALWLANTDADSRVPRDWLRVMVERANHGAHVVLGTVRPSTGITSRTRAAWLARHVLTEGHPHVHGTNFGIRADVYQDLGGWPAIASGEDRALAGRAESRPGTQISRTARIPVVTSARLGARAPHGFSSYLRGLIAQA